MDRRSLILSLVFLIGTIGTGTAAAVPEIEVVEQVPIALVLSNPAAYQIREVALKGTVQRITWLDPSVEGQTVCKNAAALVLADEPGSIFVDLIPFCRSGAKIEPGTRVPEISVGDSLIAGVQIVPNGIEKMVDLSLKNNIVHAVAHGRLLNLSEFAQPR